MYLVKKKKDGRNYYLIAETQYKKGKPEQKILMYIGSAERILEIFRKCGKRRNNESGKKS
jgi:hypothetical protein